MTSCRLCGAPVEVFLDFGPMPLANGFLAGEDFETEGFFDLSVAFCMHCAAVQLTNPVPREKMFHSRYPFFTGSSTRMAEHFRAFAASVADDLRSEDPFVVEIGSNDGTLLRFFANSSVRHLGIDPSANVAAAASENGVRTAIAYFDPPFAAEVVRTQGQADVILAANCFCHIPDLHRLAEAVNILLKPGGRLIFEDPYLGDILRLNSYDQIYDEHVFYFSLTSVSRWLDACGFEVIDVQKQPVHGGSMRYTCARRGACRVSGAVADLRAREVCEGLHLPETYAQFRLRVERSREELSDVLVKLRQRGLRVAGYGATSKSTTVLNYCGIGPSLLEFISDTTPLKQGTFSPGMHIPILPPASFHSAFPDCALLFAWNHADEILAKEGAFRASGGKWIRYVPRVSLV